MPQYGLGRRPSLDARDMNYLMPRRTAEASDISYKMWNSIGALDQGSTSQCVAYSGWKYLISGPVVNRRPYQTPEEIYRECLKVDEWPGEDWEAGTSVRALFKVLQSYGYVTGYQWAFDVDRIVAHVLTTGPVVMGTNWYRDMFTPHNKTGYLDIKGPIDGGHAWLIIGADRGRRNPDRTYGAVRMINSWGSRWGQNGRAWIKFADLDRLVKEDGEACVAAEIKISALELVTSEIV